jgi:hypothetical protein
VSIYQRAKKAGKAKPDQTGENQEQQASYKFYPVGFYVAKQSSLHFANALLI